MAGPRGASGAKAAEARPKVAVPDTGEGDDPMEAQRKPGEEPVWLVRIVLLLFLVGFAAFLAREVRFAIESFP